MGSIFTAFNPLKHDWSRLSSALRIPIMTGTNNVGRSSGTTDRERVLSGRIWKRFMEGTRNIPLWRTFARSLQTEVMSRR